MNERSLFSNTIPPYDTNGKQVTILLKSSIGTVTNSIISFLSKLVNANSIEEFDTRIVPPGIFDRITTFE